MSDYLRSQHIWDRIAVMAYRTNWVPMRGDKWTADRVMAALAWDSDPDDLDDRGYTERTTCPACLTEDRLELSVRWWPNHFRSSIGKATAECPCGVRADYKIETPGRLDGTNYEPNVAIVMDPDGTELACCADPHDMAAATDFDDSMYWALGWLREWSGREVSPPVREETPHE